jgi:hypothetical protein
MAIEPVTDTPQSPDFAAHVRNYLEFTRLFKYGAIAALAIGLFVVVIISN